MNHIFCDVVLVGNMGRELFVENKGWSFKEG